MNYTAKELLEELYTIYAMLGKEDAPETYHYFTQLLNSIIEEEN